jgi:hypothetical protein
MVVPTVSKPEEDLQTCEKNCKEIGRVSIVLLGGHLLYNEFEFKEQIAIRNRHECRIGTKEITSEMSVSSGNEQFLRHNRKRFFPLSPIQPRRLKTLKPNLPNIRKTNQKIWYV